MYKQVDGKARKNYRNNEESMWKFKKKEYNN